MIHSLLLVMLSTADQPVTLSPVKASVETSLSASKSLKLVFKYQNQTDKPIKVFIAAGGDLLFHFKDASGKEVARTALGEQAKKSLGLIDKNIPVTIKAHGSYLRTMAFPVGQFVLTPGRYTGSLEYKNALDAGNGVKQLDLASSSFHLTVKG